MGLSDGLVRISIGLDNDIERTYSTMIKYEKCGDLIDEKIPLYNKPLLPIIFLIILLSINVYLYGDNSLGGPNQLSLLLSGACSSGYYRN